MQTGIDRVDPPFETFIIGSPHQTLAESDTESTSSLDSFFPQTRDYPRVLYTESEGSDHGLSTAPARWTDRPLKCVKYVDDCLAIEKLCFAGTDLDNDSDTDKRSVRAIQTEEHFKVVEANAGQKNMKINQSKTKMICISSARSYVPDPFFTTPSGTIIHANETIKILGFNFDTFPNVKAHLKILQHKFKCRIWALRHLKKMDITKKI